MRLLENKVNYDAFISYAHEDFSDVKNLHYYLRSYYVFGFPWPRKIFTDVTKLSGKEPFSDTIKVALEGARYLVVCCSKHAKQSDWVNSEIDYFIQFHDPKNIILCLVGLPTEDEFQIIPDRILNIEKDSLNSVLESRALMRYDFRGKGRFWMDSHYRNEGLGVLFGILGIQKEAIISNLIPHIFVLVIPFYLFLFAIVIMVGYLVFKSV